MACFAVPMIEAVATTVATKIIEKKEVKENIELSEKFSRKMKWLNNMLWGGSALLAFEHVWHGEVIPEFPFLTNAVNYADRVEMLHEMATTGVGMALLVTAVWVAMVAVSCAVEGKEKAREV